MSRMNVRPNLAFSFVMSSRSREFSVSNRVSVVSMVSPPRELGRLPEPLPPRAEPTTGSDMEVFIIKFAAAHDALCDKSCVPSKMDRLEKFVVE